ncbi:SIS domain-containing protein [Janthinobacterium sp. Mn2066]|uniref:SIS domain-containing protein n=1 Tax=Janthinobacterium sp. Mn2066 TaxID=3395264 RepID=UPI003BDA134A
MSTADADSGRTPAETAPHKGAATDATRNILDVITRALPNLRRGSRQLAEFILAQPRFVVDANLADLARQAELSEPTVLRFCTTVGCSGFRDLKIRLAQSLVLGMPATHAALSFDDTPRSITGKLFDFTVTSLDRTRNSLDPDAIDRAVGLLATAARIEFFGFGASGIVALDAQQKFPLFGVPCGASQDSHQQLITASMLRAGDVMFAISNTGTTASLIEMTRIAKERGAKVIVLTGSLSPICQHADVALIAESLDNTDLYTPTISRLSALVVIDILSVSVALRRGDGHARDISEMKKQLADIRSHAAL